MANNLLIYYVGQYVLYLILIMDIFNLENHGCWFCVSKFWYLKLYKNYKYWPPIVETHKKKIIQKGCT